MIPKIAHFHWTGPPMSWLRMASIATFKKCNPEWEIRLHPNFPGLERFPLNHAQAADWTWWEVLFRDGGFQVATDIVFIRPMPEEWLEADLVACTKGGGPVFQFASLGCVAGHEFMEKVVKTCRQLGAQLGSEGNGAYQAFGYNLLQSVMVPKTNFIDMPMSAFCAHDHFNVPCWWEGDIPELPEDAIGAHWYGGHKTSRDHEPGAVPGSGFPIVRLAESVLDGAGWKESGT